MKIYFPPPYEKQTLTYRFFKKINVNIAMTIPYHHAILAPKYILSIKNSCKVTSFPQ